MGTRGAGGLRSAGGRRPTPATIEKAKVVVVDGKETYRYNEGASSAAALRRMPRAGQAAAINADGKAEGLYIRRTRASAIAPAQIRGAITLRKPA